MGSATTLIQGIPPELCPPKDLVPPECGPVQLGENALNLHGRGRTVGISPLRLSLPLCGILRSSVEMTSAMDSEVY
jgi:hypothetical protein